LLFLDFPIPLALCSHTAYQLLMAAQDEKPRRRSELKLFIIWVTIFAGITVLMWMKDHWDHWFPR
jgi:hypothetical protein